MPTDPQWSYKAIDFIDCGFFYRLLQYFENASSKYSFGSHLMCSIAGGAFYQPFTVGINLKGIVEENSSSPATARMVHNRTRTLSCVQVQYTTPAAILPQYHEPRYNELIMMNLVITNLTLTNHI